MEIISFLSIILSLIAIYQVNKLSAQIKQEMYQPPTTPSSLPQDQRVLEKQLQASPNIKPQDISRKEENKGPLEKLLGWYAHEWPLKTGALFILLGFLWLVSYAFLNNWIGPGGRVTFGFICGALIMILGELRIRKVLSQGITFVALGAGIVILTTYAAQELYNMFPPAVALLFLVLTMAFTSLVSLRYRVRSLAVASLLIGGIAPTLIGADQTNVTGLLGYLLALIVGNIWIARYSRWHILSLLALGILFLYSLTFFAVSESQLRSTFTPKELTELAFFAVTFCSLFYFATLASIITNKKATTLDLLTATGTGFYTLGWIDTLSRPDHAPVLILAASVGYAFGAFVAFVKTKIPQAVQVYTVVSLILLAVATTLQFDGPTLVTAFAIEALVLPIISSRFLGVKMTKYMLLYHLIPLTLGISPLLGASAQSFTQDLITLILVTTSTFVSGLYFYYQVRDGDRDLHQASLFLIIVGAIYGLVTFWQAVHEYIPSESLARAVSLIAYTVIGLTSYIIAGIQDRTVLKKFGVGLLIVVIGRLLIIEIWSMELTGRIITFFLIGLLFIGSVLLGKTRTHS